MRLAALAVTTCIFVQIAGADSMPVSGSASGTFLTSETGSVSGDTWNSEQTFTAGGKLYTLKFDGMFDAPTGGNDITAAGLRIDNSAGPQAANVDTAYLRATVFLASVPEPDSLLLLLTGFAGLGLWRALLRGRRIPCVQASSRPGWKK
jgi:hypothetical protein